MTPKLSSPARADRRANERLRMMGLHIVFLTLFLSCWELAAEQQWIDKSLFGSPLGIMRFLLDGLFVSQTIWKDLGWTALATLLAFFAGSIVALIVGLAFVTMPALERFISPYFSAFNAMPRIALAPLFLLWFGLGLGSKIAVGFSLTFFIVLSSTTAGIRGVSKDWITLSQILGASPAKIFSSVTLPSAVPVVFSGLRLGLVYALLGVVGCEIIASEHGLGQQVAYLGSTFNMNGVMGLLLVLALLGMGVTASMNALEKRLLRWQ